MAAFASASAAHASILVFSDNFNSENGGAAHLNYTKFANWNVVSGSVDLIGNGSFDFYPGNGLYVDLDGSTQQAGTITTKSAFAAGRYTLTFDLGGSHRPLDDVSPKTTNVSIGDFFDSITLPFNQGLTLYSFTFNTTGGKLSFADLAGGNNNVGNILDNVTLSTAVPVPPALVLFSSALSLVWGFLHGGNVSRRGVRIHLCLGSIDRSTVLREGNNPVSHNPALGADALRVWEYGAQAKPSLISNRP
jgi:hypothetical protein